jgi:PKD repeat protein
MKKLIILLLILCLIPAVSALPPKMVMTVSGTGGAAPYTIEVSEDSGDETIVTWEWVFGDGGTSKDKRTIYTYDRAGKYTLQLTVSNDKGESAVDAVLITVTTATPTATPTASPTATPTATPTPKPTPSENTTTVVVWSGATPIKDSIDSKAPTDDEITILKTATDTEMKKQTYPYDVAAKVDSLTTFKILKYRCDEKMRICGYWIEGYRDDKTVKTNSPVWISPPPITALISEVYDEKVDVITVTLKEDPKAAVEQILQMYVDNQPIGKPVTGTKE